MKINKCLWNYQNKRLQEQLLQACKRLDEHEQAITNFKRSEFLLCFCFVIIVIIIYLRKKHKGHIRCLLNNTNKCPKSKNLPGLHMPVFA